MSTLAGCTMIGYYTIKLIEESQYIALAWKKLLTHTPPPTCIIYYHMIVVMEVLAFYTVISVNMFQNSKKDSSVPLRNP